MLNVKKLLTKLMPTVGTNYITFCGVGVAWGSFTSSSTWAYTFSYGMTFSEEPKVIVSKAENATSPTTITVVGRNTTQATVNFSSTDNTKNVDWLAIGKV